jgi:hypothetical protein
MINTIIKDLQARIKALEDLCINVSIENLQSEMKSLKWVAAESLKIADRNDRAIDYIAKLLERDPEAIRVGKSRSNKPKLKLKQKENTNE